MKVNLRPLRVEDFYRIHPRPEHEAAAFYIQKNPLVSAYLITLPFAFCAEVSGRPVALAGLVPGNRLWALPGRDAGPHMLAITRIGRQVLVHMFRTGGPVWADIDPQDPHAIQWARLLGMRKIGEGLWVYDRPV